MPGDDRGMATPQAAAAAALSPLYLRLRPAIDADPRTAAIVAAATPTQARLRLLFVALHDRVLAHRDEPLARWFPSVTGAAVPDDDPTAAVHDFLAAYEGELRSAVASRTTQTNEVGRCGGLALALVVAGAGKPPLALVEIGASAGLNLNFDRYGYDIAGGGNFGDAGSPVRIEVQPRGPIALPCPAALPAVSSRTGLDLAPIDVGDPKSLRWAEACIPADRLDRLHRLRAAAAVLARTPPRLIKGDIMTALPRVIAETPGDCHLCLLASWVLDYLPHADRVGLFDFLAAIGRRREVSFITSELPGTIPGLDEPRFADEAPYATLITLTRFVGGRRADRVLARMHVHGEWVEWLAA